MIPWLTMAGTITVISPLAANMIRGSRPVMTVITSASNPASTASAHPSISVITVIPKMWMARPGEMPALNCQTNPSTTAAPKNECWSALSFRKAGQSMERTARTRITRKSSSVMIHWLVDSRFSVMPIVNVPQ